MVITEDITKVIIIVILMISLKKDNLKMIFLMGLVERFICVVIIWKPKLAGFKIGLCMAIVKMVMNINFINMARQKKKVKLQLISLTLIL